MVGIHKGDGRVRVYASRDIPADELRWGLASDRYGTGTGWHIDAEMRRTLIVDEDTWGQAFGRVFEIWENHDREEADKKRLAERGYEAYRKELTGPWQPPGDELYRHKLSGGVEE
jgi:hypothetical protein